MEKEYVVTLHNYDDLENFYIEMESKGGNFSVPTREVDCALRRPISRNTHYFLTEQEAETLKQDLRVLDVSLLPSELGLIPTPHWNQTGNFEKSFTIDTNDKNWGLLRCTKGTNVSGWGDDQATTQIADTISTTSSGKNVDVVIVDSHVNPNHPEFAVNSDGTGGTRINQFNWFQYSSALGYNSNGSYSYSNISSNHGTHVAGTVAGNTQGWARDSTIYSMEFNYANTISSGAPSVGQIVTSDWASCIFDYIRHFHKNKAVNITTNKKNPTVVNNSWGYSYNSINLSSITSVRYRGTITSLTGLSDSQKKTILESNGVAVSKFPYTSLYRTPARSTAVDADIQDAINDGIIIVASAGNSYWRIDTPTGIDYNNYVTTSGFNLFHSQGSSPGAAPNVICVGSVGAGASEAKADYSNCGPRIDIWAPGSNIVSSVYNSTAASEFNITLVNDPRNSLFKLGSISGTSMAGPQVTGILACLSEQYPRIRQSFALSYLIENSTKNQLYTPSDNNTYLDILNAPNRFLCYKKERLVSGNTQPKVTFNIRESSSLRYPRRNTFF
jgi:hypothetical protein